MYKTEFCLNNHTNGRNTKIEDASYIQDINISTLHASIFGNATRYGDIVCLAGKNNVNGTASFTLPENFRPPAIRYGGQVTFTGAAGTRQLEVYANGRVTLDAYCVFTATYSVK